MNIAESIAKALCDFVNSVCDDKKPLGLSIFAFHSLHSIDAIYTEQQSYDKTNSDITKVIHEKTQDEVERIITNAIYTSVRPKLFQNADDINRVYVEIKICTNEIDTLGIKMNIAKYKHIRYGAVSISSLFINPLFQFRGIGTDVLKAFKNIRIDDYPLIKYIDHPLSNAVEFYLRNGFCYSPVHIRSNVMKYARKEKIKHITEMFGLFDEYTEFDDRVKIVKIAQEVLDISFYPYYMKIQTTNEYLALSYTDTVILSANLYMPDKNN